MDVKKKVLFLVPSMRGGGSEKVLSLIINHLDSSKFEPILVLLQKEGNYLDDLPTGLNIIDLKASKVRYSIFKIVRTIYNLKPDTVMSTLGHLNIILALLRSVLPKRIKFIARESSIVSINNQYSKYKNILNYLYKKVYNRFDVIISQSKFMKEDLVTNYNIKENKIIIINNPVDLEKIEKMSIEKVETFNKTKFNLLIVGRLNQVKNHEAILNIMCKLDSSYHLTILGEGNLRETLLKKVEELNLKSRVSFKNFDKNPYKYMKKANVVVSTSFYEGFPNVLIESISCGTPVIAYKSIGGTSEIIENGINGYLIPFGSVDMFCEKIKLLKTNNLQEKDIKSFSLKYNIKNIIKQYEKVFIDDK